MEFPHPEELCEQFFSSSTPDEAINSFLCILNAFPTITADNASTVESAYVKALLSCHLECLKGKHYDKLYSSIVAAVTVIKTHRFHHQRSFREANAFDHILTLLSHNLPLECFCISVHFLVVLLDSSPFNKSFLLENNYYSRLFSIFSSTYSESFLSSEETLCVFHQLISDKTNTSMHSDISLIRNTQVTLILLKFLPNISISAQKIILSWLIKACKDSSHNRSLLCHAGCADVLLELITSFDCGHPSIILIFELFETLAAQSLTVTQLKSLFRLLRSKTLNFPNQSQSDSDPPTQLIAARPALSPLILRLLLSSLQAESMGPFSYFGFDGVDSGLQLPVTATWPTNGWSISFWFKVSSFISVSDDHPSCSSLIKPTLFSFYSEQSEGIKAWISPDSRQLSIAITSRPSPRRNQVKIMQITISDFELVSGRWYHFVASQAPRGLYRKFSNTDFYLDGRWLSCHRLRYPNFHSALTKCFLGLNFCGCLGPFYKFSVPLNSFQVRDLYYLGPNYDYSFSSCENFIDISSYAQISNVSVSHGAEVFIPDTILPLSSTIVSAYSARAIAEDRAVDVAPLGNDSSYRKKALLLPGTIITTCSNIRHLIYALGGIPVIFPLFTQLDMPLIKVDGTVDRARSHPSTCGDEAILSLVLELLLRLTEKSQSNQSTLQSIDGLRIMGLLLQRINPEHFTITSIDLLKDFLSVSHANSFKYDFVKFILLDTRIWIFTCFRTHLKLIELVKNFALRNPGEFKSKIGGIQTILDILREYYWYKDDEENKEKPKFYIHHITNEKLASRPTDEQITTLRRHLIDLIAILLSQVRLSTDTPNYSNFEAEDAVAIARYSLTTTCNYQCIDVLSLFKNLLTSQNSLVALEALSSLGGVLPFVSLLTRHVDVALLALDVVIIIHDLMNSTPGFSNSLQSEALWLAVSEALKKQPLSLALVLKLSQLLFSQEVSNNFDFQSNFDFSKQCTRPYLYPVILKFISTGDVTNQNDFDLMISMIDNINQSITHFHANSSKFVTQCDWVSSLCNLLYYPFLKISAENLNMLNHDFDCPQGDSSFDFVTFDVDSFLSGSQFRLINHDITAFCRYLFFILFTREAGFSANIFRFFLFEVKAYCKSKNLGLFYFHPVLSLLDQLCHTILTRAEILRKSDPLVKENLIVFFYCVEQELLLYDRIVYPKSNQSFPSILSVSRHHIDCSSIMIALKQRVISTLTLLNWSHIWDYDELNILVDRRNLYPEGGFIKIFVEYLVDIISYCSHSDNSPVSFNLLKEDRVYILSALNHGFINRKFSTNFLSFILGALFKNFRDSIVYSTNCCKVHFSILQGALGIFGEFLIKEYKDKLGIRNHWIPLLKSNALLYADPSILSESSLSPNCDPKVFLEVLNSDRWPHFEEIVAAVYTAGNSSKYWSKKASDDVMALNSNLSIILSTDIFSLQSPLVRRLFLSDSLHLISQRDLKSLENIVSQYISRQAQFEVVTLTVHEREERRRLLVSERLKSDDDQVLVAWRRVCRMVRHERSPWGYKNFSTNFSLLSSSSLDDFVTCYNSLMANTELLYQLDFTENSSRMRLLLERSFLGTRHAGKIARPSRSNSASSPSSLTSSAKPEDVHDYILGISLSVVEEDENDMEEINQIVALSEVSSAPILKQNTIHERTLLVVPCERIYLNTIIIGSLKVTSKAISFTENRQISSKEYDQVMNLDANDLANEGVKILNWNIRDVQSIQSRRYLLIPSALELFFSDNSSCIFKF
ncbi:hypothetical protein RCL1_001938 [Eukaryota sp. TZLM3-RCL]